MSKKHLLIVLVTLLTTSCALHNATKKMTSKRVYENYYVGDQGNQWFIHPIVFKNKTTNFLMDFTFRDSNLDSVAVKYSILSKTAIENPKVVHIKLNDGTVYTLTGDEKIFVEMKNKVYQFRYLSNMTYKEMSNIIINTQEVMVDGLSEPLVATKYTKKKLEDIKSQIINILKNY